MEIRVSNVFSAVNLLGMLEFYFSSEEEEDGGKTLSVFAHRGYGHYVVHIMFRNVLFTNCPKELITDYYGCCSV